jgi:hypothetical protein
MKTSLSHQVAVIGAGPYGLATAAHLRAAKVEICVFGEPMEFWQNQTAEGMLLRSSWDACRIADPHRASTLDNYSASQSVSVPRPVPLNRFIDYGRWFQKRIVPDVDRRRVVGVEMTGRGFRLDLNLRVGSIVECLALPEQASGVVQAATRLREARWGGSDRAQSVLRRLGHSSAKRGISAGRSKFPFRGIARIAKLLHPLPTTIAHIHLTRGVGAGPVTL